MKLNTIVKFRVQFGEKFFYRPCNFYEAYKNLDKFVV